MTCHAHPDDIVDEVRWQPCGRTLLLRVARDRWVIRDYAADIFTYEGDTFGREYQTNQFLPAQYRGYQFSDEATARMVFRRVTEYLERVQEFERQPAVELSLSR